MIIQQVHNFILTEQGHACDDDEIAHAAHEAAKGGHIVSIHHADGQAPVMVHPDDDHATVVEKLAAIRGASEATQAPVSKRSRRGDE